MKVKAVLDWEHCGYYPPEIDPRRYKAGRKYVVLADGTSLNTTNLVTGQPRSSTSLGPRIIHSCIDDEPVMEDVPLSLCV